MMNQKGQDVVNGAGKIVLKILGVHIVFGCIAKVITDQMRRPVAGVMHPDIDWGCAVVDREQLRVHVGHVHQMHVAEPR